MAYDILEDDLTNIPGPVAKEMYEKARVANMTGEEREAHLKAKELRKELNRLGAEEVMRFLKDSATGPTTPRSKQR